MGRRPSIYFADGSYRFSHAGKKFRFRTRAAAWAALEHIQPADPTRRPTVISEMIDAYLARRAIARGSEAEFARQMIREFNDFCGRCGAPAVADIPRTILYDYLAHLRSRQQRRGKTRRARQRPLSAETIRKKLRYASAVLTWGNRQGWLPQVIDRPTLAPVPFRGRQLSPSELARLHAVLASPRCRRVLPLVRFLLETGLRPGEARRLRWDQVTGDMLVIEQHKTARHGGRPRMVPLSPTASRILREQRNDTPHVFPSSTGRPYTPSGLSSILRRHGLSIYRLRHTWAQAAVEAGVQREVIAAIMGHANSRMLEHYVTLHDSRLRAAALRLDGLSRPNTVARSRPRSAAPRKARGRRSASETG